MPPSHPIVIVRLVFMGLFVAPSVRQYYIYITDTRCKRVGTQCWVYGAIMVTEAMLCIKNGKELFERTQAVNIIVWLLIQLGVSIVFVYGCMVWQKYFRVIVWFTQMFVTNSNFCHQLQDESESRESSPLKNYYNKFDQNDSAVLRGDSKGKHNFYFSYDPHTD